MILVDLSLTWTKFQFIAKNSVNFKITNDQIRSAKLKIDADKRGNLTEQILTKKRLLLLSSGICEELLFSLLCIKVQKTPESETSKGTLSFTCTCV